MAMKLRQDSCRHCGHHIEPGTLLTIGDCHVVRGKHGWQFWC